MTRARTRKHNSHLQTTLQTTVAVIDALGGLQTVASLTKRSTQQVWLWKHSEQFPAKLYVLMLTALAQRGLSAPQQLWQQEDGKQTID